MVDLGRYPILGVGINAVDYGAAVEALAAAARLGRQMTLTCSAVHGIVLGALDPDHRHRLNSLDMIVPDGQPVRWALRWMHRVRLKDRVRGVDLMARICERAAAEGLPVFLYGSKPETVSHLKTNLLRAYPGLVIAGSRPSAFRALTLEDRIAIANEIRESGAKLVLVGLGCPRQEIWIFENRDFLRLPLVGVGSAFDTNAGLLPQAPRWMQRTGLEWVWRLAHEPRRLWRRYLLLNPLYLTLIAAESFGLKRFDAGSTTAPPPLGLS